MPHEVEPPRDKEIEADYQFWVNTRKIIYERDIEKQKSELRSVITFLPHVDPAKVEEALEYGETAHSGQPRKFTGEPYFLHPLQVARIGIMLIDPRVIVTGDVNDLILHDTVEDCNADPDELTERFEAAGVLGLSHTFGGNDRIRTPDYLRRIVGLYTEQPRLFLPHKKAADLIVNGNCPPERSMLSDPDALSKDWMALCIGKTAEMELIKGLLPSEEFYLKKVLTQGGLYTRLSKKSGFTMPSFRQELALAA